MIWVLRKDYIIPEWRLVGRYASDRNQAKRKIYHLNHFENVNDIFSNKECSSIMSICLGGLACLS